MKRVLHVFGKMDCGGAETRTMEIYRNINRKEIQFDFLTMQSGSGHYDSEIRKLGGNIYVISSPSKVALVTHVSQIIKILKKHHFYAVHAHTAYHSGIICLAAFIGGVEVRVVHSRSASDPRTKGLYRKFYFVIMRTLINMFSTDMIACGEEAGHFLFGKRIMRKRRVEIIKNAVDLKLYKNLSFRGPMLRNKLNIDINTIVIGNVASFSPVKNHRFLITLLKQLKEKQLDFKVVFVGDGKLRKNIEEIVEKQGLKDYAIFLGIRSDIPELMSMFDILLLPSFYEGIPGVIVEAQAAGTPCIISDTITKEVDAGLGLVDFVSLNDPKRWVDIINCRKAKIEMGFEDREEKLDASGFSVGNSIEKLYKIYAVEK